jgi:hypothetical protein
MSNCVLIGTDTRETFPAVPRISPVFKVYSVEKENAAKRLWEMLQRELKCQLLCSSTPGNPVFPNISHVILDDTEVECKSLYGKPPEKDHKSFALVAYEGGRIAWEVRYPVPALGEITEAEPAG